MSKEIISIFSFAIGYCVSINLSYACNRDCKGFEEFKRTLMVVPVDYEEDLIVDDLEDQRFFDEKGRINYIIGDKICQ